MDEIDVSDIDPAILLAELYNRGRVAGAGFLQARTGEMTRELAQELLNGTIAESDYEGFNARDRSPGKPAYFDYLYGKPLKVEINGSTLRPWGYDRDQGVGAAQRAVDAARKRTKEST